MEIPYQRIINALNKITGKRFRLIESHKRFIRARWAEGFRFDDFVHVIRVKYEQWRGTEDDIYLRPRTLFGTKMDDYRQKKYCKPPSERKPDPPEPGQTPEEKERGRLLMKFTAQTGKKGIYFLTEREFYDAFDKWRATQ